MLRDAARFENAPVAESPSTTPLEHTSTPRGARIPLGPDDARPFDPPDYWAPLPSHFDHFRSLWNVYSWVAAAQSAQRVGNLGGAPTELE